METSRDKDGIEGLCGDLPFSNRFVVKYLHLGGGLALMWKKEVNLKVVNNIANHILAKVVEEDRFVWFLFDFYGWLKASQKANSWVLLTLASFVDGP